MSIHGGDIYRNHVDIDFSININPLGTPKAVKAAMYEAVEMCGGYPDMEAEKLKKAVSRMLAVPEQYLLFGNGASELFMAVTHGLKPQKTVIPVPSFYGYEYAAEAAESEIIYYEMKEKNHFCITSDFCETLTKDTDLVFLANPNNPTGMLIEKDELLKLLYHCREKEIYVVLDESFIEFTGSGFSMLSEINEFDNLILVRSFTKIFSIPGARLGYLVCKNPALLARIAGQLPEWNLSCFAQAAGCACVIQNEFILHTKRFVEQEKKLLADGLRKQGFTVFSSAANFLLIYGEEGLYDKLLQKGVLIRNCENFRGLRKGFYRIAVKSRGENEILLKAIESLKHENRAGEN
ncbi:MAG: aminotransferase class I/II-fold pyridoxal phosphate-dependent enzyme [Clostridium sp.]|nr:aminotransferase class I/II-fold pyridoxal phosphate-dependent enzyme [Clostridium sp.]